MSYDLYVAFIVWTSLKFVSSVTQNTKVWSYNDETNWPGILCKLGGKRQSPIDIKTSNVIKDYGKEFIKNGELKFIGYEKVLMSGINNGHTVLFSTEGNKAMHPLLAGGPLVHHYRLEQLHFHWLSEHSINGVKFPMEIHFVHVRSDLSVLDALNKHDGLAIISVFCNVKPDLDDEQLDATEEIMQHMPKLMNIKDRVSGVLLDITKLLSSNTNSYYTYAGSLTSPQCNEAVVWIIFNTPIDLSEDQYRYFDMLRGGRQNFRSLQTLKSHKVYTPPNNQMLKPQIVKFVEGVVKVVADFFGNVSSFVKKGFKAR